MSWNFGGIAVEKDYVDSVEAITGLLNELDIYRIITDNEFDFMKACSNANTGTAAGTVNGHTLLIDHTLPYDCSFTAGEESMLDKKLAQFSQKTAALVFFLDGISDTYGFSFFKNGKRERRWSVQPGDILCDEGDYIEAEVPFIAGTISTMNQYASESEARTIAVLESFLQIKFNELVRDRTITFQYFR
jgi:hypothetical protein